MLVYHSRDEENHVQSSSGRYIPYSETTHDAEGAYYDFKNEPELIPKVLEDFRPFSNEVGIQRFYDLLRWTNGAESNFESTDCLLRAPHKNVTPHLGGGARLQVVGRLMIIYRDHKRNTDHLECLNLAALFEQTMLTIDAGWLLGAIGYAFYPAHFTSLGTEPVSGKTTGNEFCINFWAWGNSDTECFENLGRLFENLEGGLRIASSSLNAGIEQ